MQWWSDWAAVVSAVGMSPAPGEPPWELRPGAILFGSRFTGTVDGKRVEVVFAGSSLAVRVLVEPALDLGLLVEPEGMLAGPKVATGDLEFDGLFTVTADEPARAAELLTRAVATTLVKLLARSANVSLKDDGVHLVGEGEHWLKMAIPSAVEIVHRVDDLRARLPLAAPLLTLRPALGRFATDHALRIDDNPARLSGTSRAVRVQALFARDAPDRLAMHASLLLDDSFNLDLRIEPAGLLTPLASLLPGQTDHRVGDDAFDAAFHVRTSRPELLAQALDDPTRRALRLFAALSRSFVLDDRGITAIVPIVDRTPAPVEALRAGLDAVARLSQAVRRAPPGRPQGPFR